MMEMKGYSPGQNPLEYAQYLIWLNVGEISKGFKGVLTLLRNHDILACQCWMSEVGGEV